jgi:hypothetical protein
MAPYMAAANGDLARAADVYLWATELAGALHAQISFVELAVRNALDSQIQAWNVAQGGPAEWTAAGAAQADLYSLLKGSLSQARDRAKSDAAMRGPHHPRHAAQITHDDMVAQLTFGTWVKVLRPLSTTESSARQELLWKDQLHHAFPHAGSDDAARSALGNQLDSIRYLRNRVAHHDNLLTVNVARRLRDMLSVLAKIDQDYATLAMARSTVRRLVREDPRRTW